MRPFFSYYGAKWTTAKYLGPPRHGLVIEPFAGSACYATRWTPREAILVDASEDIVSIWDWLIRCSTKDVQDIPDRFESIDEVMALPSGASHLVRFWIAKGRAEASGALSPWYFKYRNATDCRVWGPAVKRRIVEQKPAIARWRVILGNYTDAPDVEAHWHIDPPYSGLPGRRYPHDVVNFEALAQWSRSRQGDVDVCENVGATWLPFHHLCDVVSARGRRDGHRSAEAVWRSTANPGKKGTQ